MRDEAPTLAGSRPGTHSVAQLKPRPEPLAEPRQARARTGPVPARAHSTLPTIIPKESRTSETNRAVENWARAFCTAVFDIEAGRRDVRSLRRWMTFNLFQEFARRIDSKAAPTGGSIPATAVSARLWPVRPGVTEVACTVWDRGQLRGIAIRVEELRDRLIAVALEYG